MGKNNSSGEILDKIKSTKKILLSLHEGPDGDSFGSSTAMKYFLERDLDKEVKLVSSDPLGSAFESFDFYKEVEFGKGVSDCNLDEFDLILFLDHGALRYYGESKINFPKDSVINIDHHITNSYYGDLNYVDAKRPSTCSILIDLFKEWNVEFDKELSTRLLLGLYTDTQGLSLGISAIIDSAFLVEQGGDYLKIVNSIKFNVPLKLKKYYALITNKFRIEKIGNYNVGVSSTLKQDIEGLDLTLSDMRLAPNYLMDIKEVDFLFTLTDIGDLIKGSFRSRKNVDTSLFAKELGGGGHKFASAFRIASMPLDKAEKKVFDAIKKVGVHVVK